MDKIHSHIAQLREDFTKGELSENDVAKNPFAQFEKWMKEAVESNVLEVQAMNLATVNELGQPSSRIVYMREYSNHQLTFYTNFESKKGKHIAHSKYGSCLFFWTELERQIRLEGELIKADDAISDAYFNARPRESQISAWASPQSKVLKSREELNQLITEIDKKFEGQAVPRPAFWGGYHLNIRYYEFWQGRKSRRHDRIAYEQNETNEWIITRLAP
jgi:pyridoxamine 5'-phosphate oxidase